ncbi:MAG: GDSL-type esterase/lipase family protein, partial [Kiritimatiellia bacterium]
PMTINALPAGGIEFDGTSWVTLADGTYPLITLPESSEVMDKAKWDAAVSITNKPVNVTVVYAAHTYSITVAAITAPELTLMMIGDSITEGESTANSYRHDLWDLLTVAGYNIQTVGVRNGTHDGAVTTEKWSYHNAFYSARILPTGGAMGQRMSLDAELEVCGYPDVITVLMGANDVVDYGNSEDGRTRLFNVWSDYVSRLATLRPNSQILVSTVLPYKSTHGKPTWVNPFNEKLRTAWGAGATKAEPFASHPNVTLVDLYTTAGLVDADFIDQVHPNVAGCAKVAAGWSTAIQAVLNKDTGLNGNRIPIRAFNAEPTKLSVTFNKPFTADEETALITTPMTATLSGADALPTLSTPVLSSDKRSVTFTASAELPTLTALTVTLANVPAIDSAKNTIVFTALGSGAAKNVPAAFRNGFLHRKTLAIGENDRYHTTAPNYVDGTDAATAVSAVKRVAYYMELQRAGEPVQFVWASMDAFDPNEVKLGVPTKHAASATGKHQAVVNGLQVYGNRGNFANTSDTESGVKGFIEFTPYSYAPASSSVASAPAGLGAVYDWNDTLNADGEHGCMQVMQILPGDAYAKAEVLFALNRFTASGTANNVEIGIGSFSTHLKNNGTALSATLDYTNMTSSGIESLMASAYTVRKLEIWVVPAEELTWDPAKTEGNWNKTESSWSNSKTFADGNAVKFDTLTGATAATVTVTEAVAPSGLTVASNSYTFGMTGTGAITAEIVDVASGANAIFNAPLNVSNATTVNGTLTATGGTFSGATTIAANGALTTTGASTFSTTPVVNGTLSVDSLATLPATPTGAGTFVHTAGTRSLSISSTVLHKYDVQGGTLTLNGSFGNAGTASNAPSLTVANGATLVWNGKDMVGWTNPNTTQIATVAGTLKLSDAGTNETFSGKITLQGTGELKNSKTANKFMLYNSAIVEADTNAMATITGTYAIKIATGTPQLNVKEGATLTVSAPLRVETNFTINTAANATLNVTQPFHIVYSGSRTVTKNGTGTLNLLNGLSDSGALTSAAGTCHMLYS